MRLAYMRGLFYSILHSRVISGPQQREVVYQCHASFCVKFAYLVLVGGERYFQMHLHIADTTKNSVIQLEPFWYNLNEKCMYQEVIFATKEINNHNK